MRGERTLRSLVPLFALVPLALGCSSAGSKIDSTSNNQGGSGGQGGSTVATGGGGGMAGGISVGMCNGGPHCSSDLHSYVDCSGNVLMTCPDDQGCSAGTCVGACDSAKENKTSFGCDYYSIDPDITFDGVGGCFAAFVVNTWSTDVALTIDYKGQTLDPSTFGFIPVGTGANMTFTPLQNGVIPVGQIAILFLNRFGGSPPGLNTSCPPGIVPAVTTEDAAHHGTGIGSAFHMATSAPVVAYDVYPFGGGRSALTSATLLLPSTAWDDNYIAVSAFGNGLPIGSQPVLDVVAQQNGTTVTILPSVDIQGGQGVAGTPKGTPRTYTLDRGQVLQFTQGAALDGSVIKSSAPVGVWGGMSSLSITACCGESAHQQIPPVRALGSEYVAVRYRNRYDGQEESPPWRMIGAVNGTELTWDPSPPPGAPTTLQLGQVAQFEASGPFVVRSQDQDHPFYMSAHMTGGAEFDPQQLDPNGSASADGRGDAEFVNVIPPGEYLDKYIFFADPTYPETNLVLVRGKGPNGFADVELDCAGVLGDWQPVGSSGNYEFTRIDLVRHDFQPQGNCDNGRHEIHSSVPFGLTVWGWGSKDTGQMFTGFYTQYVSYAYPAGAGVAPINQVVVLPDPK
jgi:hypothetical protein